MIHPKIYFFIPQRFWPKTIPESPDENWSGFGLGMYTWTIQTHLRLKADGFSSHLTNQLPDQGIILIDHNHLTYGNIIPSSEQLIICLKQDGLPYPYSQLYVVQNPLDAQARNDYHYIPHWPQPGLIPRDAGRGKCFRNIAYFGHQVNLVSEFKDPFWHKTLKKLDLNWCPIINYNHWSKHRELNNNWNNYSEIDAVIAVRQFGKSQQFLNKPATKLYNAWLAKVPAIMGHESAFLSEGEPQKNYIEATSLEEVIMALETLKENDLWREELVNNGWIAGREFTADKTVKRWRSFLENVAVPAFEDWCRKSRAVQLTTLNLAWLNYKISRGVNRIRTTRM